jgi:hypothetical protein
MASEVGVLAKGDDFDVRLAEADKPLDAYRPEELASLRLKCGALQFHTQSSEIERRSV